MELNATVDDVSAADFRAILELNVVADAIVALMRSADEQADLVPVEWGGTRET
jgi:hypothetical protein